MKKRSMFGFIKRGGAIGKRRGRCQAALPELLGDQGHNGMLKHPRQASAGIFRIESLLHTSYSKGTGEHNEH